MRPAADYSHVRNRAPRRPLDGQTDAVIGTVIDILGLAAVLAFAAGVGAAGPLIRTFLGG